MPELPQTLVGLGRERSSVKAERGPIFGARPTKNEITKRSIDNKTFTKIELKVFKRFLSFLKLHLTQ